MEIREGSLHGNDIGLLQCANVTGPHDYVICESVIN